MNFKEHFFNLYKLDPETFDNVTVIDETRNYYDFSYHGKILRISKKTYFDIDRVEEYVYKEEYYNSDIHDALYLICKKQLKLNVKKSFTTPRMEEILKDLRVSYDLHSVMKPLYMSPHILIYYENNKMIPLVQNNIVLVYMNRVDVNRRLRSYSYKFKLFSFPLFDAEDMKILK